MVGGGSYADEFGCSHSGSEFMRWDGVNWTDVLNPSGRQLSAVAMVSATDGWAVGYGTILHYRGAEPSYQVFLPVVLR